MFFTNHPFAIRKELPNNKFDYFHDKGIDLVNKIRNANNPTGAYTATISCVYDYDFLPCMGCDAFMIIKEVYVGGNSIAY